MGLIILSIAELPVVSDLVCFAKDSMNFLAEKKELNVMVSERTFGDVHIPKQNKIFTLVLQTTDWLDQRNQVLLVKLFIHHIFIISNIFSNKQSQG